MKKLRLLIASFMTLIALSGVALPATALAETAKQAACSAIGSATCTDTSGGSSVNTIIAAVVNILSSVVGVLAVIMIIIGGSKFITSGGDSNKVSNARSTILYAIIGLVVAVFAQLIVYFVLNKLK